MFCCWLALRLHRAGLVEGLSRCVMNIVEGRAAAEAAPAAVTGREGVFSSRLAVATPPVVTLEVRWRSFVVLDTFYFCKVRYIMSRFAHNRLASSDERSQLC